RQLEELTKPKLSGRVDFVWTVDLGKGVCQVWLNLSIKNDGAPSIASSWKLSLKSAAVNIDRQGPTVIQDGYTVLNSKGEKIAEFHANNRLEEKTVATGIQRGVPVRGWLRFDLHGIAEEQVRQAEKTLYFKDVNEV